MVEQLATNQEPGMIINDHDAVNASAFALLRDVRKVTGVRLPDFTKFIFLVSFPVAQI